MYTKYNYGTNVFFTTRVTVPCMKQIFSVINKYENENS